MSGHNLLHQALDAPHEMADPGNGKSIVADRTPVICPIVTVAAETRLLPNPTRAGIRLTIFMRTDGGDCVITASAAINVSGNTIITLDTVRDAVELLSVTVGSDLRWQVITNVNGALS